MVRNLMMIVGLTLAVAAFGCDSDSNEGAAGSGGSGGSGGGGGEGGAAGEGGAGGGEGGAGGAPAADACDNTADRTLLESGTEPPLDTSTSCGTGAFLDPTLCTPPTGYDACLRSGADGAATPTMLSEECSPCFAALSCCGLSTCGPLGTGDCLGAPTPGDACDVCTDTNCGAAFEQCSGLPYGFGR
jgi:hypothetical protein